MAGYLPEGDFLGEMLPDVLIDPVDALFSAEGQLFSVRRRYQKVYVQSAQNAEQNQQAL